MMWFFLVAAASAATINVPAAAPTVRDAVNAAVSGDAIVIDSALYVEEPNDELIFLRGDLTIEVTGGGAMPRVPGIAAGAFSLRVSGVTLVAARDPGVPESCPASLIVNGGLLDVANVVLDAGVDPVGRPADGLVATDAFVSLEGVRADNFFCVAPIYAASSDLLASQVHVAVTLVPSMAPQAGGFVLKGDTNALIESSSVRDTVSSTGGAVWVDSANAELVNVEITDNFVDSDISGAGVTSFNSRVDVVGSTFARNRGTAGGILAIGPYYQPDASGAPVRASLTVSTTLFESNIGQSIGDIGGIGPIDVRVSGSVLLDATGPGVGSIGVVQGAFLDLAGTRIQGAQGSAVGVVEADAVIDSSELIENGATTGGALVAIEGDVLVSSTNFHGNRAGSGGAIFIGSNGSVEVDNSDFDAASSLTLNVSRGGFVFMDNGPNSFTATGSRFAGAVVKTGSVLESEGQSAIVFDGCIIDGNSADVGGIFVGQRDTLAIRRSELLRNTGNQDALIQASSLPATVDLQCNRVCENVSASGLVFVQQTVFTASDPTPRFTLRNNVWFANQAGPPNAEGNPTGNSITGFNSQGQGSFAAQNNTFANERSNVLFFTTYPNISSPTVNNNIFFGVPFVALSSLSVGAVTDYNLYHDVGVVSNDPAWPGPNDIFDQPEFQGYPPGDCGANLWLAAGSPGFREGEPTLSNLDGTRSSVGFSGGPFACLLDEDGDGVYEDLDCDDTDANNFPGNIEVCDGADNDCDGLVDEADPDLADGVTYYQDVDGDGFGDPATATVACSPPGDDWVTNGDDCDDDDDQINPDADEVCDGVDNDCDGLIDDEDGDVDLSTATSWFFDGDGDGFGAGDPVIACLPPEDGDWVTNGDDCDDDDDQINPDAVEVCDGVDNDCDSLIDDDDDALDLSTQSAWYTDADGDGFGTAPSVDACAPPTTGGPWVLVPGDCDDTNAAVNPDALEICDGIDNDCDGLIDDLDDSVDLTTATTWFVDGDGDGYGAGVGVDSCSPPSSGGPWVTNGDDCDDTDATLNPETAWYVDADGDGFGAGPATLSCEPPSEGGPWVRNDDDCDDDNASINPDATEVCDGVDNDCDTLIDDADPDVDTSTGTAYFVDADGDGFGAGEPVFSCAPPVDGGPWVTNDDDCDDNNAAINPDAVEVCDGLDNDCDGLLDEEDPDVDPTAVVAWYLDLDGDGYGVGEPLFTCSPPPGGPWTITPGDCDDTDPALNPETAWYADVDEDGFGAGEPTVQCEPPAQGGPWVLVPGDCDDDNDAINPDAVEVCDAIDNNCSELVDDEDPALDSTTATLWFEDTDGDGFGGASLLACSPPLTGGPWVTQGGDCDDDDAAINPDAVEICDGVDNDCDGLVDDDDDDLDLTGAPAWYLDADEDGFGAGDAVFACLPPAGGPWSTNSDDCDDTNAAVNPEAAEVCDGVDNDCDGLVDEDDPDLDPASLTSWYVDADGDGYGAGDAVLTCDEPTDGGPWVTNADDCDDDDAAINPAADEVCDGVDNDCDGLVDDDDDSVTGGTTWYQDADGDGVGDDATAVTSCDPPAPDGWVDVPGDCDDADPARTDDCTGEAWVQGGCGCDASGGAGGVGWLVLLGGALLARRRRGAR